MSAMAAYPGARPVTRLPLPDTAVTRLRAVVRPSPASRMLERPVPVLEQPEPLVLAHPRLVAGTLASHRRGLLDAPGPGRDPGEVGSSERGRLNGLRDDDGGPEDIGLELH